MKVAVIDMGTNTFNLLIADCKEVAFQVLQSYRIAVKLGQRDTTIQEISEEGITRMLNALEQFNADIKRHQITKVFAIATSAIRTAHNQEKIKKIVKDTFDIDIQIIDGNKEAELIYYAVRDAVSMNNEKHLIIDIGGGSTEFIIANNQQIFWKQSFLLGMARLIDIIKPTDPISAGDVKNLYTYLDKQLTPLLEQIAIHHPRCLVGSSGVFDSVVEMIEAQLSVTDSNNKNCEINLTDYYKIADRLIPLSYTERLKFKGLIEMRADMINISMLLINYVIQYCKIQQMKVSFYSLKEGALIEYLQKKNN